MKIQNGGPPGRDLPAREKSWPMLTNDGGLQTLPLVSLPGQNGLGIGLALSYLRHFCGT